jgi:hypothetical protein
MMFSLTALLCPLLVFVFIIVIIVLIVRSAGRSVSRVTAESPRPPTSAATRLAEDGFWLSSYEPASIVYYHYWAAGTRHEGQIVFQPGNDGRQFIYTGARPEQVQIVRVVGPSGSATYVQDDSTDFTTPILGAVAAEVALDAIASAASDPPAAPSTPPQFPAAY